MNRFGNTLWNLVWSAILVIVGSCSTEQDVADCVANSDCALNTACVSGKCIQNVDECEQIGAIARVTEYPLNELDFVQEAHVYTGSDGRTSMCYWGTKDGVLQSRYVSQVDNSLFEEEDLVDGEGAPIRCISIFRNKEGKAFIVSRETPSIVWKNNGIWERGLLPGLQSPEALGAMLGPNIAVNMASDDAGGVYLAMSIGFDLGAQALYIATANAGVVTSLLNGWMEEGANDPIGHAPQIVRKIEGAQTSLYGFTYYHPESNTVRLVDTSFHLIDLAEGIFASISNNDVLPVSALLMDRNRNLRIASIRQTKVSISRASIVYNYLDTSNGQIPWKIANDVTGTTHVVSHQPWIGSNTLVYFQIDPQGVPTPEQIISENYAHFLPAGQLSSIATDVCGRATISFVKHSVESTSDTDSSVEEFSVEIVEGI